MIALQGVLPHLIIALQDVLPHLMIATRDDRATRCAAT